jgi:hypothetical protein
MGHRVRDLIEAAVAELFVTVALRNGQRSIGLDAAVHSCVGLSDWAVAAARSDEDVS